MRFRMLPGLILLLGAAVALQLPVPAPPPPPATHDAPAVGGQSAVDEQLHRRIDEWIARNGLNTYGDPPGTMYMGGTPLFDEATGAVKDRYLYILEKHPELKDDGSRRR
jgi:hypothetical protein